MVYLFYQVEFQPYCRHWLIKTQKKSSIFIKSVFLTGMAVNHKGVLPFLSLAIHYPMIYKFANFCLKCQN